MHKTVLIPLKQAEVDVGVAEVIRWLNSYVGVMTFGSCQGSEGKGDMEYPQASFVKFICAPQPRLIMITNILARFRGTLSKGNVRLSINEPSDSTYALPLLCMTFSDEDVLAKFSAWIVDQQKPPLADIKERLYSEVERVRNAEVQDQV